MPREHKTIHFDIPLFFKRIERGIKCIKTIFINDFISIYDYNYTIINKYIYLKKELFKNCELKYGQKVLDNYNNWDYYIDHYNHSGRKDPIIIK